MAARIHKEVFSKVAIARDLLRQKAEEILNEYLDVVQKAKDAGNYEVAAESLQWLIEHMPSEEDGTRAIDTSVDKQQKQVEKADSGPRIQIGIQVGGTGKLGAKAQKTLPEATDAEIIES